MVNTRLLKKRNNTKELIGRLLESKFFVIGGLIVLFLTILAIIAPYVVVYDPNKTNLIEKFIKPEWFSKGWSGHVLGTNALGQDLLTRLLIGARLSFIIAAISTAVAAVFGVALGIISAYYGGFLDNIIMRVCDVQLSIPVMVLAVAVVAMLEPSVPNLIIVLIVTSWVQYARVVRSNVIITKKMEFIMASRALGHLMHG